MHKPLLLTVAGLVAGVASPLQANDFNWDFYGKLDVQALYADANLLRYADEGWQIEAPFSRLGFKADQALTDDLKLIAVYEWQVNGLDDSNKGHRFGSRNTYFGIASQTYGELTFGKNDSKFKKSEGKIDLFNETLADMAQLTHLVRTGWKTSSVTKARNWVYGNGRPAIRPVPVTKRLVVMTGASVTVTPLLSKRLIIWLMPAPMN